MRKGIIMEIHARHWIVMTQDGEFVKIPKTNSAAQIGEEIRFQAARTTKRRSWMMVASAAVAAMLGMFFVFPQFFANQAHAETYVYLDLNPSIAIGLDKDQHVVQIKPLNTSAEKLVGEIDWQDRKVDEVAVDLIDHAEKDGYLHKKDHVIISGIKEDKNSVTALQSLEKAIDSQLSENSLDLEVHTLVMPKQVQAKAEKTGLSPTKYAVWLLAKKEGQQIPVEELEEKSITELADIEPVTELLQKPLTEQEWNQIIQEDGAEVPASGNEPALDGNPGKEKQGQNPGTAEPSEGSSPSSNDADEDNPEQPADGNETPSTDQPPASGSSSSESQDSGGTGDSGSGSTTGTDTNSSEQPHDQ